MDNISLVPDTLFSIAGLPVSSAHVALFAVTLFLAVWGIYVGRTAKMVPTGGQVIFEAVIDWFNEKIEVMFTNPKEARRIMPLIVTFFLVILLSNLFGLYPFINNIVISSGSAKEAAINLFTTPSTHLSMTLALTIITLLIAHISALSVHPLKYLGNYIKIEPFFKMKSIKDLPMAILDFFLGLLDIIGEVAKLVSLSCRLFGNVLAGELMALVIMGLSVFTQFIVPLPFIVLGIFSGIIQALVFALLSLNYISLAVSSARR